MVHHGMHGLAKTGQRWRMTQVGYLNYEERVLQSGITKSGKRGAYLGGWKDTSVAQP
jgi:hypothetical protein